MTDIEDGLARLADHFSWVSIQPHYNAEASAKRKYGGWAITMKTSDGKCYYVMAVTLQKAVDMAVLRHCPVVRKIKLKR